MTTVKWKKANLDMALPLIRKMAEIRCTYHCDLFLCVLENWEKFIKSLKIRGFSCPVNIEKLGNGDLGLIILCSEQGVSFAIQAQQSALLRQIHKTLKNSMADSSKIQKLTVKLTCYS